jgi:ABC-type lipoprotein release transport system permease subunit
VDAGRYLQQDGEAVVGSLLARNLGVGVGDEVVFLGSGKESGVAALVATVVGTFTSGMAVLDRSQVHVTLSDLGGALGLSDEVHAIALQLDSYTSSQALVDDYDGEIFGYRLANWGTLMPDLAAQFEMKIVGSVAFYALFVVLVTFGVVNAFIMTIHERTQEFGVLLALGMRPGAIVGMLQIEALCMSVLGLLVGISLAAVVVSFVQVNIASLGEVGEMYEHLNLPQVLRGRFNPEAAIVTGVVIVLAIQLAAVFSTLRLYRMKVVEALMTEE